MRWLRAWRHRRFVRRMNRIDADIQAKLSAAFDRIVEESRIAVPVVDGVYQVTSKAPTPAGTHLGGAVLVDVPRSCRVCGCTDDSPCFDEEAGACRWVGRDLCSWCRP